MNFQEPDEKEDQLQWEMATSAIRTGSRLRTMGSAISALSVVSGVLLALVYIFSVKGDYGTQGAVTSLVGIVPAFALGQFLNLYGTRGVLHGIQVQNSILDLDIDLDIED